MKIKILRIKIPIRATGWNKYMRHHVMIQYKVNRRIKHQIKIHLLEQKVERPWKGRWPVDLHITAHMRQPLDADNVCDKPVIDALVDYGLFPNDNLEYLNFAATRAIPLQKGEEEDYMEIEIS
jgi:hypothetical protein